MVPQETLGAPLKPRLDASGAASATAGSAPVFFKAALPVFLVEHRSFFSAPATDFLLEQQEFFSALQTNYFRRNYYEFSKETNYI